MSIFSEKALEGKHVLITGATGGLAMKLRKLQPPWEQKYP